MVTEGVMERIPETLEGIAKLLTAREWEKAAICYAFTRPDPPKERARKGGRGKAAKATTAGNGRSKPETVELPCSYSTFAAFRFVGLSKRHTVQQYRDAWANAVKRKKAKAVRPGDVYVQPDLPWTSVHKKKEKQSKPTETEQPEPEEEKLSLATAIGELTRESTVIQRLTDQVEALVTSGHTELIGSQAAQAFYESVSHAIKVLEDAKWFLQELGKPNK